jgi:hypothetical protein
MELTGGGREEEVEAQATSFTVNTKKTVNI